MPLPSALAARLSKRGLINKKPRISVGSEDEDKDQKEREVEEEVIAESYDDQENQNTLNRLLNQGTEGSVVDKFSTKYHGYVGCPNKWNIHHECTFLCKELWKEGKKIPGVKYLKRKAAMLKKYPLPAYWEEVYDPGTGQHYYWETDSSLVSWLPPGHPRAVISESAAALREQRLTSDVVEKDKPEEPKSDEESSEDESDEEVKRREAKKRRHEVQEKQRAKGRIKVQKNDLDPMDPASYSDIPRGGWSEGLSAGNEAKTGADVTAAGPLYQMRPYPNPGAVLRANAATTKPAKTAKKSRSPSP